MWTFENNQWFKNKTLNFNSNYGFTKEFYNQTTITRVDAQMMREDYQGLS